MGDHGGFWSPFVRRAGDEKRERSLSSGPAHFVAPCCSFKKVDALFINVWRSFSRSCSHVPSPSATSSTNRYVPPAMSVSQQ